MAINYAPQIYDLWAQGGQQYNAVPDIVKMLVRKEDQKRQDQGDFLKMLQDLDPTDYVIAMNQKEQADMFKSLNSYAANLVKSKGGKLEFDDMMDLQFQIGKVERWQAEKLGEQKRYFEEIKEYDKNPGLYDPVALMSAHAQYYAGKGYPAQGALDILGIDPSMANSRLKPFTGKPVQVSKTELKNGKQITVQYNYFGTGSVDPNTGEFIPNTVGDNEKRIQASKELWIKNPQVKKGAKEKYDRLFTDGDMSMAQNMEYINRAKEKGTDKSYEYYIDNE